MFTYWLLATGALLASIAVGLVVRARFRPIVAITVAIVCLVLLAPALCSQMFAKTVVSEGGFPGPVTEHVSPPRCFTVFDVETPMTWAGAFPAVVLAVAAGVLVVYAGRLRERRCRRMHAEPVTADPPRGQ